MKILKASAGSGKTYNLAKEYIRILLTSPVEGYRHVLAVTFTNKATDEMKRRILKELHVLATSPGESPYLEDLLAETGAASPEALSGEAAVRLAAILHDYSSFAVSTIDRFFQQTLRAFSREIGQTTDYQVELDRDSLVDEAVDRVLGSLSEENRPLLDWVVSGVRSDLAATGRFTLDRRLKDIAVSVVSEPGMAGAYSKEGLVGIRDACDGIISAFVRDVREAAAGTMAAFDRAGVSPADTNRGFIKAVPAYAEVTEAAFIEPPTAAFIDRARDPGKWFVKAKAWLLPSCMDAAVALDAFCALFGNRYSEYATAMTVRGQVYGLGLAAELRKAFDEVQRERGVICIDDTNAILREVIGGTDAPFLYEKLGVRFSDFLLDEFQDTSSLQWENLLPLLRSSEEGGGRSLAVGDVKQSIYRWRGGDWGLLDHVLQEELGVAEDGVSVLGGNYRTCRAVVSFNNRFFPFAAAEADRLIGNDPEADGSLSAIYSDVVQEARTKDPAPGRVDVRFLPTPEDEMDAVVDAVRGTVAAGGRWGDVAVLVRGNAEGGLVAERLVAEGIPVMSDDSLHVKGAPTVRRLVSQLSLVEDPARAGDGSVGGYLAREMHVGDPGAWHSPADLAEGLLAAIREVDPETFEADAPFIQAFMDWLQDWSKRNGGRIASMLRDWEEADPKIASPEGCDAVRVMTVHKSKGLEFPHVIVPFAEKVTLYRPASYWCRPALRGTALERTGIGTVRASLSEASMNSLFRDDYLRERSLQAVDNLNVLYVAMTRARCELTVLAAYPPKAVTDAAAEGRAIPAKNLSHLLYAFCGCDVWRSGTPYDYAAARRGSAETGTIPLSYACRRGGTGPRPAVSMKAAGDGDGTEAE